MVFNLFEKKQKVLARLAEKAKALQEDLAELSPDELTEFLQWMRLVVAHYQVRGNPTTFPDDESPSESKTTSQLPTATPAIKELLSRYPEGLRTDQITKALEGKFQTTSDNPNRVIYSCLAQLTSNGTVVLANGVHRLKEFAGVESSNELFKLDN